MARRCPAPSWLRAHASRVNEVKFACVFVHFVKHSVYSHPSTTEVDGVAKSEPRLAPDIGQHSGAILSELGLSQAEIDRLVADGAVGVAA